MRLFASQAVYRRLANAIWEVCVRLQTGLIPWPSRHVRCLQIIIRDVSPRFFVFCSILALLLIPAGAQQISKDLSDKSLEDLMNIEVTSVSKRAQTLSKVASAIFVITQDEIQHSGSTNIPDLLRMVPGLDVSQISGQSWAIGARGLNAELGNKLLVLIDGRTVYSPIFAGVYWDVQDVPLEDIERIEVIRGPGATVWGANAVNGVINIITKPANETQGGLLVAGAGTHQPVFGIAQYGGHINKAGDYRIFVKGFDQKSFTSILGPGGNDDSNFLHAGFRVDSVPSKQDSLTAQGDLYKGGEGEINQIVTLTPPFGSIVASWSHMSGGNLLGRWNHTFSAHSDTSLQVYFDKAKRHSIIEKEEVRTVDLDFQHHFEGGNRNEFVWGAGYRRFYYDTAGTLNAAFDPASATWQVFSTFLQDQITVKQNYLYLTLGAKFEHNDSSRFEFQPSARLAWTLTKSHLLWVSYSRARRTPSPEDRSVETDFLAFPGPGGIPAALSAHGSLTTVSENLDAFEAGYRGQIRARFSLDLAAFYNKYEHLKTFEPGVPFLVTDPLPHLNIPLYYGNQMYGETHGIEAAANWKVTNRWTLSPGYAFEQIHLHTSRTSGDRGSVAAAEGNTPRHQAQLRSNLVLKKGFEWNASLFFVDRLPAQDSPSYTRLDTGLTW